MDILRIMAMYMVVIWHAPSFHFGWSGLSDSQSLCELWHILTRLYQVFGVDGVNVFALLTGYLCIDAKWHADRYVRLWLQAAFYGIGLFVLWWALQKVGVLPERAFMTKSILANLIYLPGAGIYWYVVAYTGLFFLIPFINNGLKSLNKRQFQLLLAASVGIAITIGWKLPGIAAYGYSTFWLICLYALGAYFRLHPTKSRPFTYCLILAGLLAVKTFFYCIQIKSCIIYNSIFDVSEAVLWLLVISRIQIKNAAMVKIIAWLSIASFGVYLIHTHPFAIYIMHLCIAGLHLDLPSDLGWVVPLWSAAVYLVCAVIDQVRIWAFSLCRAKSFCDSVAQIGTSAVNHILAWLNK